MRHLSLLISLTLVGCGGTTDWSTPEDCEGIADSTQRDECYAEVAPEVFRLDPEQGEEVVARIEDSTIRDFTYLTVTREVDPGSSKYCEKIEEEALAARCRVLVSRPHLHKELQKAAGVGGGPGSGPGGPGGGPGGPGGGPGGPGGGPGGPGGGPGGPGGGQGGPGGGQGGPGGPGGAPGGPGGPQ